MYMYIEATKNHFSPKTRAKDRLLKTNSGRWSWGKPNFFSECFPYQEIWIIFKSWFHSWICYSSFLSSMANIPFSLTPSFITARPKMVIGRFKPFKTIWTKLQLKRAEQSLFYSKVLRFPRISAMPLWRGRSHHFVAFSLKEPSTLNAFLKNPTTNP